jgi:hypothetical protein
MVLNLLMLTYMFKKNDSCEMIEFCPRCKENGIPNIFCVLPRRGREHDYPWITFRITCTSTAKHWKGSPFWIGAEFLVDPSQGSLIKVFSPPIHVQSKVKSREFNENKLSINHSTNMNASSNDEHPQLIMKPVLQKIIKQES